jgi:hypothetical protein
MEKSAISHTASPTDQQLVRKVPYIEHASLPLSPSAEVLLQHLMTASEYTLTQILEKSLSLFAQQNLAEEDYQAIESSFQNAFPAQFEFCTNRQVALFKNVLSPQLRSTLFKFHAENNKSSLTGSEVEHLDVLNASITRKYFCLNESFVPHEFEHVTPYTYDEMLNGQDVLCDQDDDYERQISYIFNVSNTPIIFIPVSTENVKQFTLHDGDCLVYPSNFSCSYNLQTKTDAALALRCYRLTTTR